MESPSEPLCCLTCCTVCAATSRNQNQQGALPRVRQGIHDLDISDVSSDTCYFFLSQGFSDCIKTATVEWHGICFDDKHCELSTKQIVVTLSVNPVDANVAVLG